MIIIFEVKCHEDCIYKKSGSCSLNIAVSSSIIPYNEEKCVYYHKKLEKKQNIPAESYGYIF